MSEATSLAAPFPRFVRSEALIGASSPLWGYFAGAALVGAAWWWASRWGGVAAGMLESAPKAIGAVKPEMPAPEPGPIPAAKPALVAPAAVVAEPAAPALLDTPPLPTGRESAPVAPLAAAEPGPPPAPPAPVLSEDATLDVAPEPAPAPKRKAKDEPKPH